MITVECMSDLIRILFRYFCHHIYINKTKKANQLDLKGRKRHRVFTLKDYSRCRSWETPSSDPKDEVIEKNTKWERMDAR